MTKIYTKTGDDGTTGLIGGKRISKSNPRILAYGLVDELNASLGMVLANKIEDDIVKLLKKIQNDLFVVGSDLANPDLQSKTTRITENMVRFLEDQIDKFEQELQPLGNFILPGGDISSAQIHFSRTISRRAESYVVKLSEDEEINKFCISFMNRLSDLLFIIARVQNRRRKVDDVIWKS